MFRLSTHTLLTLVVSGLMFSCSLPFFGGDPELSPGNYGNMDSLRGGDGGIELGSEEQSLKDVVSSSIKLLFVQFPGFAFYDYARLNEYRSGLVKLELFKYAQTVGSIRIKGSRMCILSECSFKWPITKKFFGGVSYGDLILDILFSRDIFGGKGKMVGPNGVVVQRFQQSGQLVYYERKPGHTLYKNMTNGVVVGVDDYIPFDIGDGLKNSLGIRD